MEVLALFLVGLSLFFHGVGGIKLHLQGLTSRRLRRRLADWAEHPVLAALWGVVAGAILQSSTAVAFILTSLVAGGGLTVAQALPVVAWANLGTVVLVFCATVDLHVAFLYLLGLAGVALAFELGGPRWRPAVGALFGAGLLFFGLGLMKDAFAPLSGQAWFREVAAFAEGSAVAIFVVGALLRVLVQSSSAVAVIAVALAQGGLLRGEQAVVMMFGTGAGVAASVWLLASGLRGVPRRIALFQALINGAAAVLLVVLFALGRAMEFAPLAALTGGDAAPGLGLAFAYLALQGTAVAVALVTGRHADGWLERWAPPTDEQDLGRPKFLHAGALEDPESALVLVEQEQRRLLHLLPAQLDTVRAETAAAAPVAADVLQRAGLAVGQEVQAFLHELVEHHADHATSERLLRAERRQHHLAALAETVHLFVTTLAQVRAAERELPPLLDRLAESLNTLLLTAIDAAAGAAEDVALLHALTSDRGDLMERLRRNALAAAPELDPQQRVHLSYLTTLFERAVWLLRQYNQAGRAAAG